MAQNYIEINGVRITQPTEFEPNWETTYTSNSGRVIRGIAQLDPLFTVESYNAKWGHLTPQQVSQILKLVVPTPSRPNFTLKYYSWYYGAWRTDTFYVGKGSLSLKTLRSGMEGVKSLSFNLIGVNPII